MQQRILGLDREVLPPEIPHGTRGARARRHTLTTRHWASHRFVPGAEEFGLFLNLYDALVARFGVAADERFATVLNGITKERQRRKRPAV